MGLLPPSADHSSDNDLHALIRFQDQIKGKSPQDLKNYEIKKTKKGDYQLSKANKISKIFKSNKTETISNIKEIAELASKTIHGRTLDTHHLQTVLHSLLNKEIEKREQNLDPKIMDEVRPALTAIGLLTITADAKTYPIKRTLAQCNVSLQSKEFPLQTMYSRLQSIRNKIAKLSTEHKAILFKDPEFINQRIKLSENIGTRLQQEDSVPVSITAPLENPHKLTLAENPNTQYNKIKISIEKWLSPISKEQLTYIINTLGREDLGAIQINTQEQSALKKPLNELATQFPEICKNKEFLDMAKLALLAESLASELKAQRPNVDNELIQKEVRQLLMLCDISL
ncbi:MAG: hypothetical protein JWO53_321, partial [Chlamydiia bacterium]|nr:hypothetical protein [Chlamydiia bacterium]